MKKIFNYTILLAVAILMSSNVMAQRIEYIEADSIVVKMPEFAQAQQQIEAYALQKQKLLQLKEQQIVALQQEIQLSQQELPKAELDAKVAQLQKMQQDYRTAQSQAQRDVAYRENLALGEIYSKLSAALKIVALQMEIDYIADKKMFLYARTNDEVTNAVLSELGLK